MWRLEDDRIKLITVEKTYTDFLRTKIDNKIPIEHDNKRPFIGILI